MAYVTYSPETTVSGDSQFMISEYDLLTTTNTFDIEALDKTLDYIGYKCFRALYQNQKTRIHMDRYDVPITRFLPEYRTQYESKNKMYSRRYIYYVDRPFIHYSQTQAYRTSEFYQKEINQETIGKHVEIFSWNFLIFIDGDLVTTCEVLPLESKTGVIIDLESPQNAHGLTFKQYEAWVKEKATVSVIFMPNFKFTDSVNVARAYLTKILDRKITTDYISPIDNNDMDYSVLTKGTLVFHNTPTDIHAKRLSRAAYVDEEGTITFGDMTEFRDTPTMDLSFITFDNELVIKRNIRGSSPFLSLDLKMPIPAEHLLVFVTNSDGYTRFGYNIEIKEYYHNVFEFKGLEANESAIVYAFYTEKGVEHSETYFRQTAFYEEYYSIVIELEKGRLPNALKNYNPLFYTYNEVNYSKYHSEVTPSVFSYKIDKLRYAIETDPWTLWAYLLFLNLNLNKMFVYMENIELGYRERQNTYREPIANNDTNIEFEKPHYLFSVNKSYISGLNWKLRLFLDGKFLNSSQYAVREGMDYYYIYVLAELVTATSVLEIERHRGYEFFYEKTFLSTADTYNLMLDDEMAKTICAWDVYLVDMDTNEYLTSDDYTIGIETWFVDSKKQLTRGYRDIDVKSCKHLGKESHIRIKNRKLLRKRIQIGIHKEEVMEVGPIYEDEPSTLNCYVSMSMKNEGNYTKSNFRVFRNGLHCIPQEFQLVDRNPKKFGGELELRTLVATHKGDQLVIDHVPSRFRMIYYQAEIDLDGYIDLDGKVHLPVSLRWYDIYVDGYRLSPKNIRIISPTRFYIINVPSLANLVIMDRDRDDDVFFLQPHIWNDYDDDDRNNTLIDDLFDETDLRNRVSPDLPDFTPPETDPPQIIDPDSIDLIIFFEHYMRYTHIDSNLAQLEYEHIYDRFKEVHERDNDIDLTQVTLDDMVERFGMIFKDDGVCTIDGNEHVGGGYLLKIDCNEIDGVPIGSEKENEHEQVVAQPIWTPAYRK